MATIELHAQPRTILGKKVKAMRRRGVVPANIYGNHVESTAIEAELLELRRVIREAGRTNIVNIVIAGEAAPRSVVIRKVQRKPTNDAILHVDFQQVSMREMMTLSIHVRLTGVAPIVEIGDGVIVEALSNVEVECLPGDMPQHIEADLSGLDSFDSHIKVGDLRAPRGVTILTDPDLIIASVTRSAASESAADEAAEAAAASEAAGEEPATGTAEQNTNS
jgi:large subunit ribosomal protein L25